MNAKGVFKAPGISMDQYGCQQENVTVYNEEKAAQMTTCDKNELSNSGYSQLEPWYQSLLGWTSG